MRAGVSKMRHFLVFFSMLFFFFVLGGCNKIQETDPAVDDIAISRQGKRPLPPRLDDPPAPPKEQGSAKELKDTGKLIVNKTGKKIDSVGFYNPSY